MLKSSEKEFERLIQDARDVKECITKYISYAIGAFGLTTIAIQYYLTHKYDYFICLLLLFLFIIAFLVEIIWYKIKSHNQIVGYMQLLSQEQKHFVLDEHYSKINKINYLRTDGLKIDDTFCKEIGNLSTWEFLKSRLNSGKLNGTTFSPNEVMEKLIYNFVTPTLLNFEKTNYDIHKNWDIMFFEEIIKLIYDNKSQKTIFTILRRKILNIIYLYYKNNKMNTAINNNGIDRKYLAGGWNYPIKIFQIVLSIVVSLILIIWITLFRNYCCPTNGISWSPTLYLVVSIILITYFAWRISQIPELVFGKYSIDYYCWIFLGFRVQILNRYNVVPKYFSRSYIRFHKTKVILNQLTEEFINAHFQNVEEHNKDICFNELNNIICSKCVKGYKEALCTYQEFDQNFRKVHIKFYKKILEFL